MALVTVVAVAMHSALPVSTTTTLTLAGTSLWIASSTSPLPLVLSLSAGILTTLNPCGFVLLPAYVAFVLHGPADRRAPTSGHTGWQVLRSGLLGVPLTAGFLVVFLVAGGLLALGGHLVVALFPWLALVVGAGLIALGGWILVTKRTLEVSSLGRLTTWLAPRRGRGSGWAQISQPRQSGDDHGTTETTPGIRFSSQVVAACGFGLGYGVSSLGCALPIFLLVVANAITATDLRAVLLILAAYGLGIVLVMFAVALTAAAFHDLLRTAIFPLLRWVQPLSAVLILAAGVYIVVYQVRAGLL